MEFETSRLVVSIIIAVVAVLMGVLAGFNFNGRGPLISQTWTMATPEQRETIDKKAEYRSVAIVLTGLAVAFIFIAGFMLWEKRWMFWLAIVAAVLAVWLGMCGGINRFIKFKKEEDAALAQQPSQEADAKQDQD